MERSNYLVLVNKQNRLPDDWESIDADSVTHTVKYIKDYNEWKTKNSEKLVKKIILHEQFLQFKSL